MDVTTLLILGTAAFAAGGVNAVAGGGSLISFPALLYVGYPSIASNVTNTVAIWPGTVGGTLAYRAELGGQRRRVIVLGSVSLVGGVLGSILLLMSPTELFDRIVPFLILLACALLALQPRLSRWVQARQVEGQTQEGYSPALLGGQFLASIYGGYFGAGLSIMMLALLGIFLQDNLHRLNALKGLLALLINGIAVLYFAVFGPVVWTAALLMAVTSWLGGFFGVRFARRLSPTRLRMLVLIFGVVVALNLLR